MYQIRQDGQTYTADQQTFLSWLQESRLNERAELLTAQGWRPLKTFSDCAPYLTNAPPPVGTNWAAAGTAALIGGSILGAGYLLSEFLKSEKKTDSEKKADAPTRRLFLSFDYDDKQQVDGFRLLAYNKNVDLEFRDGSLRHSIDSKDEAYIKRCLREQMNGTSVCVCLIGENTHKSWWVDWEVQTCADDKKGILGVRLKGSNGRIPAAITRAGGKTIGWDPHSFADAIEAAAKAAGR